MHLIDARTVREQGVSSNLVPKFQKNILFIGTTEASSKIIKSKAIKAKAHYVNHRWIGGMLTNQSTMLKCIKRFRLSQKNYGKLSKKEESILMKKRKNLNIVFGGIQDSATRWRIKLAHANI